MASFENKKKKSNFDNNHLLTPDIEIAIGKNVTYDYALEGLRGLAALWVAYAHALNSNGLDRTYSVPIPFNLYLNASHGAILIFFVLSGYVIGLTNQKPFSRANAVRYLLRRLIRLYPIYAISIILAVLASPHDTWKTIVGNLLFLQVPIAALLSGNGVLWTLHYEIVYYLIFIAIWYFRPKIKPLVWGTLIVACSGWFIPTAFPKLLSSYAVGWLFWLFGLYLAWKKHPSTSISKVPLVAYLLIFIATDRLAYIGKEYFEKIGFYSFSHSTINLVDFIYFPISIILFAVISNRFFYGWKYLSYLTFGMPLISNSYLLTVGLLSSTAIASAIHTSLSVALIRWRVKYNTLSVMAFFGSISYGIYVLHMPMMIFIQNYFPWSGTHLSFVARLTVWILLTVGLSLLLELKMQPLLKYWFQKNVIDHI
jgi:peptidoglycan/LPS O-acetylase OafA/YrhL